MLKNIEIVIFCVVMTGLGETKGWAVMPPSTTLQEEPKKKETRANLNTEIDQMKNSMEGLKKNQELFSHLLELLSNELEDIKNSLREMNQPKKTRSP